VARRSTATKVSLDGIDRRWLGCETSHVTSRVVVIAIDAVDPVLVADFWCGVLGWEVVESDAGGVSIASPDGSSPAIDVCRVPDGKTIKNRLHFDLRAQGTTRGEELQRLLDLGARRVDVGQDPDVSWAVLADPEGNEFCLLLRTFEEATGA
jgi:hypothetical protein